MTSSWQPGSKKLKDNPYTGLAVGGGTLTSGVQPAVPPHVQFALAATRYAHHYDYPMEELKRILAKIAMTAAERGRDSKAHFRREITLDDVLKAPTVPGPLDSTTAAASVTARQWRSSRGRTSPRRCATIMCWLRALALRFQAARSCYRMTTTSCTSRERPGSAHRLCPGGDRESAPGDRPRRGSRLLHHYGVVDL